MEVKSGNAFLKMKQVVTEQFRPGSKTVDNELIAKIQAVKEARCTIFHPKYVPLILSATLHTLSSMFCFDLNYS
jgi:ABC-type enterochelin transport system substrate-binding protein